MNDDQTSKTSLLSDKSILEYMSSGKVIIEPFIRSNLNTSSYDVTLGKYYYREQKPNNTDNIYNPYSEKMVKRIWGEPSEAKKASDWSKETGIQLEGIDEEDEIIWIGPGDTILAHTNEFIGGRNTVTTMMKARSSLGRNFIEVCKCAGWGDVGYVNRWTMEITNNSRYFHIPLVVGRRVAQIVFFDTDGILDESYEQSGKYQQTSDVNELKDTWNPSCMLPKMYNDREVKKSVV